MKRIKRFTPVQYLSTDEGFRLQVLVFVLSLVYATTLTSLPITRFADRANYLTYASSSAFLLLKYSHEGILSVIFNEPLWLALNTFLHLFLNPENVIRVIIFFSSFTFSFVFLRADPKNLAWLILFLLLPAIVKHYIILLRQGLGLSVFMLGFFASSEKKRWFLMGLSPLIHSSFFLVLPIIMAPFIFNKIKFDNDLRWLTVTITFLIISLSLGVITQFLGARQAATYNFQMAQSASGLGFLFWTSILFLAFCESKLYLRTYSIAIFFILIYLITYFFLEVTARIFESGLPIVLLSLIQLTKWRKYTFAGLILFYWVLSWFLTIAGGGFAA